MREIGLFASDLPAGELLEQARKEATREQLEEVLRIAVEIAPELDGWTVDDSWDWLISFIVVLYLVLTFGWAGSPGHFSMFALAAGILTQGCAPSEPRINGGEPFSCKTHVADAGEAEADLGSVSYTHLTLPTICSV